MLWKRATKAGGFWGLLCGTSTAIGLWGWVRTIPSRCATSRCRPTPKPWPELYRALWSWLVCIIVTVVVSYATKPRPVAELEGLVYGVSPLPQEHDDHWYQKPILWAGLIAAGFVILNIIFW